MRRIERNSFFIKSPSITRITVNIRLVSTCRERGEERNGGREREGEIERKGGGGEEKEKNTEREKEGK